MNFLIPLCFCFASISDASIISRQSPQAVCDVPKCFQAFMDEHPTFGINFINPDVAALERDIKGFCSMVAEFDHCLGDGAEQCMADYLHRFPTARSFYTNMYYWAKLICQQNNTRSWLEKAKCTYNWSMEHTAEGNQCVQEYMKEHKVSWSVVVCLGPTLFNVCQRASYESACGHAVTYIQCRMVEIMVENIGAKDNCVTSIRSHCDEIGN